MNSLGSTIIQQKFAFTSYCYRHPMLSPMLSLQRILKKIKSHHFLDQCNDQTGAQGIQPTCTPYKHQLTTL